MAHRQSQNLKRPLSELEDNSDDTRIAELRLRYKTLHPPHGDKTFSSFLNDAGERLVTECLDQLQKFLEELPEKEDEDDDDDADYRYAWVFSLKHSSSLGIENLYHWLYIKEEEDLKTKAVQLAFLWNHPQFYDRTRPSTSTMLAVLRFKSKGDGREIAEALQRPAHPSRVSSNVIQNGYDSPFLKPDLIVDPILKILDGYAKQWEKPQYFAPYAALFGPSTSGETRLLMEMSRRIYVVFICPRPREMTGCPPRSALADHLLPTSVRDISPHYYSLIASIFQVVANFPTNKILLRRKKKG
ncbi:hypothetical protein Pst134EA_007274 [Puccinia striiformis f. sp. tritici]|uniref:hypothetical protein n=1 Tax=Puccinia striiformis f. sp. tritici TaxID=168172 RepID=UPI00200729EB|nr:hypothetical protein Pst134EA_007274 [Puccinia striiformis f. sp. tritici]KAH9470009.1 hypothetical protein Pst134EA_007274 [Puccinia striiformis f. sp. tritici]